MKIFMMALVLFLGSVKIPVTHPCRLTDDKTDTVCYNGYNPCESGKIHIRFDIKPETGKLFYTQLGTVKYLRYIPLYKSDCRIGNEKIKQITLYKIPDQLSILKVETCSRTFCFRKINGKWEIYKI